jgi:hypothetical protein
MSADSPIVVDELSSNPTDHFKVLETLNHGQKHFKCNYCNLQFKGTGTRCYVHLTGEGSGVSACTAVPENVITCIKAAKTKKQADSNRKRQASEAAAESKRQRRESVPGGSSSVPTGSGGGSVRSSQVRLAIKPGTAAFAVCCYSRLLCSVAVELDCMAHYCCHC